MADGLVVPPSERAAALYRRHGPALRAYVGGRIADPAAVEDICQETFLAALARGLPTSEAEGGEGEADDPDRAARWLFGIARNKVLRHVRDLRPPHEPGPDRPGREQAPDLQLDAAESRRHVRVAVEQLPADQREVILLRYESGLPYQEIAETLEVPFTTVQGRLKRARQALRKLLAPLLAPELGPGGRP